MSHFTCAMFSKFSAQQPTSSAQNTPSSSTLEFDDLEPERKFTCPHPGCLKAYRQSSGLRYHIKHVCRYPFFLLCPHFFSDRAIHLTCLLNFPWSHRCWSRRCPQKSRSCGQSHRQNRPLFSFKSAIFPFFVVQASHVYHTISEIYLGFCFMLSFTHSLFLTNRRPTLY